MLVTSHVAMPPAAQVQGVNFRSGTIDEGNKLGVVGHVENTSSGTVTGEVQGESKPVAQMKVSYCREGIQNHTAGSLVVNLCFAAGLVA